MKEKIYQVYCTTNKVNGMKYIGSHSRGIETYLGSGVDITKAIKEYGKENFSKILLAEVDSYNLMRELEEYWCKYFNVSSNPLFYNKTNKGVGSPLGWVMDENVRKVKNLKQRGKSKHTSSSKLKISNAHKGLDRFGNKGKNLSPTHREKAARNRYKPILQYSLQSEFIREWDSATTVSSLKGWNRANIHDCCRGKQKTSYGYKWKYKN